MPTVTLALRSQRGKPIPDRLEFIEIRGRVSGPVHPADIEWKPAGELVLDLVPDHYTIDIEPAGFVPSRATMRVGSDPIATVLEIESLVTTLPRVSELSGEQKRLLGSLDVSRSPGDIWHALTDNKAATFFQITHALTEVTTADGTQLSTIVDRIVRLGGAQLTAPDAGGTPRTVIGWRMHVVFVGGTKVADVLFGARFKRDSGEAHPTHKRFGFVNSFREKGANPRLQFVLNHEGVGADVDLDNGAFHKSSPHDVFKNFAKRFPKAAKIYRVR